MDEGDFKKKLRSLGHNPREIANSLQALGIRGEVGNPSSCPIAQFSKELFPGNVVRASHKSTWIIQDGDELLSFRVRNPWAVRQFMKRFDEWEYPELLG